MRRFATSLFLVILASLIFYGGAGVNFVSYCCGVCEKEGVEALLEAKCCEIHGHDHSRDKLANNTVECCGMNGCGIERVDFDWNSAERIWHFLSKYCIPRRRLFWAMHIISAGNAAC